MRTPVSIALVIVLGVKHKKIKTMENNKNWTPELREDYYFVDLNDKDMYDSATWDNMDYERLMVERKLIFKTKEECIVRAKQLLEMV